MTTALSVPVPTRFACTIVEQRLVGKLSPELAEDVLVDTDDWVAVIDGATDKSRRTFTHDGRTVTGGKLVALTVAECLRRLPGETSPRQTVDALSAAVRDVLDEQAPDLPTGVRPNASVVVFSTRQQRVWRVGDTHFRIGGDLHLGGKLIDRVAADMRAAIVQAELAAGRDPQTIASYDPGREAIMPLLERQGSLANTTGAYGFGVIDGQLVHDEHITVCDVPPGAEVVLASDGYTDITSSLAAAEAALAQALAADPLCVDQLRGTKGLAAGQASFDDRAWVRLMATPRP